MKVVPMKNVPMKHSAMGMLLAGCLLPLAAAADPVLDALTKSKLSGNVRLRYENVDIDSPTVKDATALTVRTRLGIETAPIAGFTAVLEFEDTHVVAGEDNYAPEHTDPARPANNPYAYAAIVDPEMTEINRAYLRYRGVRRLDLGLGRQRILYDNQRFVGNVGWRQDEQTFDAFTANYTGLADWNFSYAYVDGVNGISSERPIYNFDLDSSDHLLNIAYSGWLLGKLTGYAYLLDNREPSADLLNTGGSNRLNPALRYRSNDSYGLRFDGAYVLPTTLPLRLLYTAEYARQELESPTRVEFDTDYYLLEGGVGYGASFGVLSAKLAREVLGSDDGLQGFQTPYATKHAFGGWVDMFLNTPTAGLERNYITLAADLLPYGVKAMLVYHEFTKDEGSGDFGDEWDFQLTKQFGANYTLGVKYASYRADDDTPVIIGTTANVDTDKFWLWGEFNF